MLTLKTPPAVEPLALPLLKDHLSVSGADSDALLTLMISAARMAVESELGRALITQVWQLTVDRWSADSVTIPLGPVVSVDAVTYQDAPDDLTHWAALDPRGYFVDLTQTPPRLYAGSQQLWATPVGAPGTFYPMLRVEFTAGYGPAPDDVPETIRAAMLLLIASLYANREAEVIDARAVLTANPMYKRLLAPYRIFT